MIYDPRRFYTNILLAAAAAAVAILALVVPGLDKEVRIAAVSAAAGLLSVLFRRSGLGSGPPDGAAPAAERPEEERRPPAAGGGAGLALPVLCLAVLALAGACDYRLRLALGDADTPASGAAVGPAALLEADGIEMKPKASAPSCTSGRACLYSLSSDGLFYSKEGSTTLKLHSATGFRSSASCAGLASPADGDVCYDTTLPAFRYYSGGWTTVAANDSLLVHLADSETLTGAKTFSAAAVFNGDVTLGDAAADTVGIKGALRIYNSAGTFYSSLTPGATANRAVTLPDAAGALVLDSAAQTLTNKTLGGNLAAGGFKVTGMGQGTSSGEALHAGRQVATTAPLSGGGALTGDLTLSIGASSASAAGSMSAADFIKLRDLAGAVFACSATQTTDATQTTAGTYTPADGKVVTVHARVSGRKNDGTEAAGYVLAATYRRAGGTTTQVGTTTALATHEDSSGWDATLDASGTGVRVRVTGAGSTTVDWACNGTVTIVP